MLFPQAKHQRDSTTVASQAEDMQRKWRSYAVTSRNKSGVSSSFNGWTSRPDVMLHAVPRHERVLELLDLRWAQALQRAPDGSTSKQVRKNLWCDISQNPRGAEFRGSPGTQCTSSSWYSFEKDVVLDGEDQLLLQGWSSQIAAGPDMNNFDKKDLAAEGFTLPCMATCLWAFYHNPWGEWWGAARRR